MIIWVNVLLKNLTLVLVFAISAFACGGGATGTTTSYGGTYKEEFTGIETGTWELTINSNGNVAMTPMSVNGTLSW